MSKKVPEKPKQENPSEEQSAAEQRGSERDKISQRRARRTKKRAKTTEGFSSRFLK